METLVRYTTWGAGLIVGSFVSIFIGYLFYHWAFWKGYDLGVSENGQCSCAKKGKE